MEKLENLLTGKVTTLKKGSIVVESPLTERENQVTKYVASRLPQFEKSQLRRKFPDLKHEGPIVLFDLETSGLGAKSSVVSIAYAVLKDGQLTDYCVFPSDPGSEGEAISHFLRSFHTGATFVTFNGNSFDVPKLSSRARQWGVQANGNPTETFAEHLASRHIDVYPLARRAFRSSNGAGYNSLQAVERLEFEYERPNDLPSKKIPEVYRRWVYQRDNPQQVAQLIDHNMQDNRTSAAILLKLLERKN